jgi:putative aldouronate transport system permease protein
MTSDVLPAPRRVGAEGSPRPKPLERLRERSARRTERGRPIPIRRSLRRHWQLYLLVTVPLAFLFVFNYWPLLGSQIAFRNYNPIGGMWGSPWVGLENFRQWVSNPEFWPIMENTLVLSLYSLLVGIPTTIILALALNEVRHPRFKKFVQTVTYAPYFISVIVLIGMMQIILAPSSSLLSEVLGAAGIHHVPDYFANPSDFASLYVWSGVWQTTGYGAIIYLGVLANVDPTLYEAARIDGASILQKIRHVDLPAIKSTIVILLLLSLGSVLGVGFEKVFLMQNALNLSTSQVVSTYVYDVGLVQDNFSFGTAVGLFNSVISFVLIIGANFIARRTTKTSLF